jgi:hypothetical protein
MNYVDETKARLNIVLPGLPEELLELYVLLVFVKGKDCTLEDVHDAWSIWRNQTNPTHKSLIPFDELTDEVKALDRPYMLGIRQVASVDKHASSL